MKDSELHSTCGISQLKFSSLHFRFSNLSCDKPLINFIVLILFVSFKFQYVFYPNSKFAGDKSRTSTLPGTNSNTLISNLPGTNLNKFNIKFAGDNFKSPNIKICLTNYIIAVLRFSTNATSEHYESDFSQGHKYWSYRI